MRRLRRIAGLLALTLVILAAVLCGASVFVEHGAFARLMGDDGGPEGRQNVALEPVLLTLPAHSGVGRSEPHPIFISVTVEVAGARERKALCRSLPLLASMISTDLAPQVTRLISDAVSFSYRLHPHHMERFNVALGEDLIEGGWVFVHPLSQGRPRSTCSKPEKEAFRDG